MINSVGSVSVRQFGLRKLGLVPGGHMEDIVRGAIGLATEGFFEGVADGRITVHRDRTIARLLADEGRPYAELSDGTRLPADVVVCATGFTQGVPFLPLDVQERLLDERGNFMLYRQIIPFSMHNVDEVLDDLDLNIKTRVRALHWLNPIDPAAYRGVTPALLDRLALDAPRPGAVHALVPEEAEQNVAG
jgi:hypothetical protein